MNEPTHVAYSDESYCTVHRFRSIAVLTMEAGQQHSITEDLRQTLSAAGLREFKWTRLRQARDRFAAISLVDRVLEMVLTGRLRVDVLIWDITDSRHNIPGRDDPANFQRMYYHLFKNVLHRRWPPGSTWHLYPDQNSAMDWDSLQGFLDDAGLTFGIRAQLLTGTHFRLQLARDFSILEIHEVASHETPLCQVADLMAGLGSYSHSAYAKYVSWGSKTSGQLPLPLHSDTVTVTALPELSKSDHDRCTVIKHLVDLCRRHKLRVGISSSRGLKTHDPQFPINFWTYEPQHPSDRAPVKP